MGRDIIFSGDALAELLQRRIVVGVSLEGGVLMIALEGKVSGIVNGIDTEVYNPETDPDIYQNFNVSELGKKTVNKTGLQEELGLPVREDVPVIGIVSRLVKHKGFNLVKHVFEDILKADVQFAILGSGEWEFETFFHEMSQKYPEKVGFKMGFIPALARKIYAGADIFLMPSQSEPCGLQAP